MIVDFISKNDLHYPILIFLLFIIPKFLVRWRVPGAISAFVIGVLSQYFDWYQVSVDPTVYWVATFGITSLFLYAGMEVDFGEIARHWKIVLQHLAIRFVTICLLSYLVISVFGLGYGAGALIGIAMVGPSTGFIFDSLSTNRILTEEQKRWVRLLSISTEILAVLMMLVAVQLNSPMTLIYNIGIVLGLIFLLPLLVSVFARFITPYAPQSEFGFLILVAIVAGLLTRKMGTYYIVGAFIAGISAHQFRNYLPSDEYSQMTKAVSFFSSFFIPFYFFKEGTRINLSDMSIEAVTLGIVIFLIGLATRILPVVLHRAYIFKTNWKEELKVSVALTPTLIFGLVICELLRFYELASASMINSLVMATMLFSITPFLFGFFWKEKLK